MLSTSTLRPARAFCVRLQPASLIAPCCATASFATSTRPTKIQRTARPSSASKPISKIATAVRRASTAPSAASPSSTNPATTPHQQLTWNDFLALRRTRRKISVAASSISAIATTYSGLRIFIDQGLDGALAMNFGLDPLMVTGFSAIGMMAIGWLVGPFFGNAIFNLRYRSIRSDLEIVRNILPLRNSPVSIYRL
jgi:import inner membrane translocase subunit TIM23